MEVKARKKPFFFFEFRPGAASQNILVKVYFVNTSQTVLLQITVITLGTPQILTHKTLSHLGWSHLNRAPFPNVYF